LVLFQETTRWNKNDADNRRYEREEQELALERSCELDYEKTIRKSEKRDEEIKYEKH
jgi:hypothetical protein